MEGPALFWKLAVAAWPGLQPTSSTIFSGLHSVFDAIQGVVPMEWVSTLVTAGLPVSKARSVAGKVGVYFVDTAQLGIWHPCCDAQIAREHSLQITQQAKVCGKVHAPQPRHHGLTKLYLLCLSRVLF